MPQITILSDIAVKTTKKPVVLKLVHSENVVSANIVRTVYVHVLKTFCQSSFFGHIPCVHLCTIEPTDFLWAKPASYYSIKIRKISFRFHPNLLLITPTGRCQLFGGVCIVC